MGRKRRRQPNSDAAAPGSDAEPEEVPIGNPATNATVDADRSSQTAWLWLACTALASADCARLGRVSRSVHAIVEAAVAECIETSLSGGCIATDVTAGAMRRRPLLALSHLESLAKSSFLFDALRGLLRSLVRCLGNGGEDSGGGWLLEVQGGSEELCDTLVRHVFTGAASDPWKRDSAAARLQALLFLFAAPSQWTSALRDVLRQRADFAGRKVPSVELRNQGGAFGEFMRGLPRLLPVTKTASACRSGNVEPAALVCQLLERLTFPATDARLVLRASCGHVDESGGTGIEPRAGNAIADVAGAPLPTRSETPMAQKWPRQTPAFERALQELEQEAYLPDTGPLEFWAIEAGPCHYVVVFDG
mmetsp:Transcript_88161/g.248039  ORF Transcript_88161/g.248039 Transcript_88161/m.248039 type:complete len:363 (-) Transcript_88161:69-1157(-)